MIFPVLLYIQLLLNWPVAALIRDPLLHWGVAAPLELGIPMPQVNNNINKLSNYGCLC